MRYPKEKETNCGTCGADVILKLDTYVGVMGHRYKGSCPNCNCYIKIFADLEEER